MNLFTCPPLYPRLGRLLERVVLAPRRLTATKGRCDDRLGVILGVSHGHEIRVIVVASHEIRVIVVVSHEIRVIMMLATRYI